MHSFNALQAGDVYGAEFGTGFFYEQAFPQQAFDARLVHILNHVHTTLGKPWKELNEYIFGFEAENEAMIGKVHIRTVVQTCSCTECSVHCFPGPGIHPRSPAMVREFAPLYFRLVNIPSKAM